MRLKKGCAIVIVVFIAFVISFFFICGEQLHYRDSVTDMLSPSSIIGEITSDKVIEQQLKPEGDMLTGLTLMGSTFNRVNTGSLVLEILNGNQLLNSTVVDISDMADNVKLYIPMMLPLANAESLTLRITAPKSEPGNAVTLYYGNSMSAAHVQVKAELAQDELLQVNGSPLPGVLCCSLHTRTRALFGTFYWYIAVAGLLALFSYCALLIHRNAKGKDSWPLKLIAAFSRYRFLIKQLVARDFKSKYKRSVLGVCWSFLNPLLTMMMQYVVFSKLFRSDIPNFALYLLSGIVCFSFFSESTNMALSSIVGNASLITKVYVPKYIFPLTRVMSSLINLLLSLIPLFALVLLTRTPLHISFLLLPFGIVCLFMFCFGIGLILSSAMVFFRDTQFLWGVITMLWMYATPVFYPESILPTRLMPIFKCNPLYHIIRFVRVVLMDGVSPEPKAYILMLIAAIIPLALGLWVFKKTQDKFVLYL